MDPRTLGTQIDDSIMDKSLDARLVAMNKNYLLNVKTKVLDGRIFLTGKVDSPEEKLMITKLAWETKGARSVRNDIKIKEEFNFKQSAKDLLITSQLRTALIVNKIGSVSTSNWAFPPPLTLTVNDWFAKKFLPLEITSTDVIVPAALTFGENSGRIVSGPCGLSFNVIIGGDPTE